MFFVFLYSIFDPKSRYGICLALHLRGPYLFEEANVRRSAVIACASQFDMFNPGRCSGGGGGGGGGGGRGGDCERAVVAVKYVVTDLLFFHATNVLPVRPRPLV